MNPKISAVLWDMDGVLVDTREYHFQAWFLVMREIEVMITSDQFGATFGKNNRETLSALLRRHPGTEEGERMVARKEQLFRDSIQGRAALFSGVKDWLDRFEHLSVVQAVASSAPKENIEFLLDELAIRSYFTALVSGHTLPSKPDPAVFLEAARQATVPASNCLVIEDSPVGVQAAKSAGMRCVAVATTRSRRELEMADIVLSSLEELKYEDLMQ